MHMKPKPPKLNTKERREAHMAGYYGAARMGVVWGSEQHLRALALEAKLRKQQEQEPEPPDA
jgi:hypothetical protein